MPDERTLGGEPLDRTPPMLAHARTMSAARVGLVAGAGTAGILIGFGLRHGTALQPFTGSGRMMLGGAAARMPEAMLAFFGAAAHFAVAAALGWIAVLLWRRAPQWTALPAAAVSLSAWVAAEWLLPASLRALTADLSRPQQLVYFSVLAVTLWFGIRFAPTGEQAA